MKEKQLTLLENMYSKYIKGPAYHDLEIKSIKEEEGSYTWCEKVLELSQDNFDGMISTKEIVDILKIQPTDDVLDIGSGFGGVSFAIAKTMQDGCKTNHGQAHGHVTGIEIQSDRCEFAKRLSKKLGVEDYVRFECDYFPDTKVLKQSYTKIVSVLAILHFLEKEKALERIGSLLAPGGILVIDDYFTVTDKLSRKARAALSRTISIPNLLTKEKYIDTLRKAGITIRDEDVFDLTEKWSHLCSDRVRDIGSRESSIAAVWGSERAKNHLDFCKGVHELYTEGIVHGFRIIGTKMK